MGIPANEEKVGAVVGGDPTIMRANRLDPNVDAAARRLGCDTSIEAPCQECGRTVLLTKESQRIALGDPQSVVELNKDALGENRIAAGPPMIVSGGAPVLCIFCAFADQPELVELFYRGLADAKRLLGEE